MKNWALKKSPWIFHLCTGSCNNCDIELLECLTPRYDVERFGILLVGSVRHADALIVTGALTRQCAPRLKELYDQMPKPGLVIALGQCACSCCIFKGSYNIVGPIDKIVPVDVYIPGCPPKPEAMISGIVKALGKL
ncbi:NADH-quinone oxidoreductase subunit B family protein [bacterium]|nr:NADH-quinone oxidoreductase subunit B family protein [bacterium]